MQKITSLTVSQKLKEIGFNKEEDKIYTQTFEGVCYDGFDLETLISALPIEIMKEQLYLTLSHNEFCKSNESINFISYNCQKSDSMFENLYIEREQGESLADSCGKMILLLSEKGLINFDK